MADKFLLPIRKSVQTQSRHKAEEVYAYLRENYPADVLTWVKDEDWQLRRIPLTKIKMARRPGGARDMEKVKRIAEAIRGGEKMEPVVLVQTADGYKIADGYHRTLAFKHAGKKSVYAYVAVGEHDKGPWDAEMHEKKLNKSVQAGDEMKDDFYHFLSTVNTESGPLLEAIASDVHDQWVDFAKKVAPEMPEAHAKAWESMYIPYDELSEDEKEKDRVFARHIIGTILDTMQTRHAPEEAVSKALIGGHSGRWEIKPENQQEKDVLLQMERDLSSFGIPLFVGDSDEFGSATIISTIKKNKSIDSGDYRTPNPLATIPGNQPHADDWLESWGADTHVNGPQDVYTFYRRVMGHNAKDSVTIKATDTNLKGTHYRVSDGKASFNVYVPKNGPPRLLKALTTYTPTSNSVWSILNYAGYDAKPQNGAADINGCKVTVKDNRVSVSGKGARDVFQLILAKLKEMQTSEDWVDGHMTLGKQDTPAVKPW